MNFVLVVITRDCVIVFLNPVNSCMQWNFFAINSVILRAVSLSLLNLVYLRGWNRKQHHDFSFLCVWFLLMIDRTHPHEKRHFYSTTTFAYTAAAEWKTAAAVFTTEPATVFRWTPIRLPTPAPSKPQPPPPLHTHLQWVPYAPLLLCYSERSFRFQFPNEMPLCQPRSGRGWHSILEMCENIVRILKCYLKQEITPPPSPLHTHILSTR